MRSLRGRKAHAAVGVALLAVVVGGVGRGSAAPRPQDDPPKDQICDSTTRSVPGLPCTTSAQLTGSVGISTSVRSDKSRMVIHLAGLYSVLYLQPNYRSGSQFPVPKYYAPKRPKPGCTYTVGDIPADSYAISTPSGAPFDPNRSHRTPLLAVGQFPPTKVSMLAFGAIPVTAVLHANQPLRKVGDHYQGQMIVDEFTGFLSVDSSGLSGCDPAWEAQMPPLWAHVTGAVELRISDVKVDGQPVDVGSACRAVRPAQLNLWGDPNYVPLTGGNLYQQKENTPVTPTDGSKPQYLLHPGSTNLTIPAFAGCRGSGGDDLSRLITAMVSGDDNTAAVQQTFLVYDPNTPAGPELGFDPRWPRSCSAGTGLCPDPPGNLEPPPVGR